MKPLAKFTLKLAVYSSLLAYVAVDVCWCHGPISRKLHQPVTLGPVPPDASGVVARVLTHAITKSQLQRAIRERLWLEGKTNEPHSPAARQWLTYAVLGELIQHELLRVKAKAHANELRVDPAELERRYQELTSRFASEAECLAVSAAQGLGGSAEAVKARLAAQLQQEQYLESRIQPLIQVTEAEVQAWYQQHAAEFTQPERLRLRHVFLAVQERSPDEARRQLETALQTLRNGTATFEQLVASLSEDESSRPRGGELGWMSRARLPEDFAQAVFALPDQQPTIIQTRIGCHLVEVLERKPAEPRRFEDCRSEITAALSAVKRRHATEQFLTALRRLEEGKIEIFHEKLAELTW